MQLPLLIAATGLLGLAAATSNLDFCPSNAISACCKTLTATVEGAATAAGADCKPPHFHSNTLHIPCQTLR